MKTVVKIGLALALWLGLAAVAQAGWVIEFKEAQGPVGPSAYYAQDNMIRQEMGQLAVVMDLNKEWLYYLNLAKQVYWEGPAAQMESAVKSEVQGQIETMLENLPPEQREAVREAMNQSQAEQSSPEKEAKIEVKKGKGTAVIAGHKCVQYQVFSDGELAVELWLAKSVNLADEVDSEKSAKLSAQMAGKGRGGPMNSPEVQALYDQGFPLRQVIYSMGLPTTIEATKAEKASLPASLFKVPEGFKKVEFMEVMGGVWAGGEEEAGQEGEEEE